MASFLLQGRSFYLISLLTLSMTGNLAAQAPALRVQPLALPAALRDGSHEFSGLCLTKNVLLLLGENRADGKKSLTAGVFGLPVSQIKTAVTRQDSITQFYSYTFHHLDILQRKLPGFEGLEAIQALGSTLFFSVETNMTNSDCYIIKGRLLGNIIEMDTLHICALPKPRKPDGGLVYNAGFESLLANGSCLTAMFEYNYLPKGNHGFTIDTSLAMPPAPLPLARRLPFRITDIAKTGKRSFIGINFFYPGNDEKDFRCDSSSNDYAAIYHDGSFHFYARLLQFSRRKHRITLTKTLNLPHNWQGTNWEGITPFLNGWLLINDKFTRYSAKQTELVYMTR